MRCVRNTLITAFLIVVVMCTAFVLWYIRPYMPRIAQELAICAMVLIGLATAAIVYSAMMGALALWHWQESKHHANSLVHVPEHGTYVRQEGGRFTPLYPASVHVAALTPGAQTFMALNAAPTPAYPTAPPFSAIAHQISPGRLILGYTLEGPVYGDVTDLLSMAFVGKPGTGKSSALLYYLAMLVLVGADVHVFDHQGSLSGISGLLPYASSFDEFEPEVAAITQEIAEREALWRAHKQVRRPMLVLVDELPGVARWEQRTRPSHNLLDLAERIVIDHRKHNVFCLLSGTSLPAEVLPTLTRDNLSSRVVFNSSNTHARMAGLDDETRKLLLPLLRRAQPGTAILDVSRRPAPDLAALPYTTVADLREILSSGSRPQDGQADEGGAPVEDADDREETPEPPVARLHVVTGSLANAGEPLVEPPAATARDYRLSAAEQVTLVALYQTTRSIERSLRVMRKGTRYSRDASRILRERGLIV